MSKRRVVASLVVAGLSLSACNREDGGVATPKPPPAQAKSEEAVLAAGDLPDGWKPQGAGGQLDEVGVWEALTQCLGVGSPVSSEGGTPGEAVRASSPTYGSDGLLVTSSVSYMVTEPYVQRIAQTFTGPQVERCAQTTFTGILAQRGAVVGSVEVTPLDPGLPGSITSGLRATGIAAGDGDKSLVLDYVVVFKGTAISRLAFLGVGEPVPDELRRSFVSKVVERS